MPASFAEADHEYAKEAILRLQAESDGAQAIIDRNKTLIEAHESKLGKTVDKLIEEHPGTPSPEAKSAAAAVKSDSKRESKSDSKSDSKSESRDSKSDSKSKREPEVRSEAEVKSESNAKLKHLKPTSFPKSTKKA